MSKKRKRKATQPKAPPPRLECTPQPLWFERLSWQIGALAVLVLLAYANSLDGKWVYDDAIIFDDPSVVGTGFGWSVFLLTQARPLTFLSFHWNYLATGEALLSYHVVNTLLHAANAVLVLLVARRHLSSGAAFIAAALYAVHPLNTEAVSYIYQRSTTLATLFALLSLLLFLKEQYVWSAAAFGASLLCKEETIALPIFLLLYDLLYRRRRPRLTYYVALLGLVGLAAARSFYVWNHASKDPTIGYRVRSVRPLSFVLTEPRVVWRYLQLFLVPVGQSVDHGIRHSTGLFSPISTLPAILGLAVLVGLLAYLAWRGHQPAFWGLGFFILLAPTSSIVPVQDLMFEHRVYFPSVCLVIAAAQLLVLIPRRALLPVVGVILVVLLALTIARNRLWHDSKVLWTDAIHKSPDFSHPWATMGRQLMRIDVRSARQYLDRAAALEPDNPGIQNDAGVAALRMSDGRAAAEHLRVAVALRPNISSYQSDMGLALFLMNDNRGALEHFQKAIALGGPKQYGWAHVGDAYYRLGQVDQAADSYRRALQMDPCMGGARTGLVRALGAQGKLFEAAAASQIPPGCSGGGE